jgi:hypothetical protein
MPLKLTKSKAELSGEVVVDDAEDLFRWLSSHPKGKVAAARAAHMHTAVLQAVVAGRAATADRPADPFLAECFRQLLPQEQDH